jgi:hypothetical protein
MVPEWGGIAEHRLALDRGEGARFPSRVRLQVTLLGIQLGELEVVGVGSAGQVGSLALRFGWMGEPVMARLLEGLVQLAQQAAWNRLVWRVEPSEQWLGRLARSLQFVPTQGTADEIVFERRLADA